MKNNPGRKARRKRAFESAKKTFKFYTKKYKEGSPKQRYQTAYQLRCLMQSFIGVNHNEV